MCTANLLYSTSFVFVVYYCIIQNLTYTYTEGHHLLCIKTLMHFQCLMKKFCCARGSVAKQKINLYIVVHLHVINFNIHCMCTGVSGCIASVACCNPALVVRWRSLSNLDEHGPTTQFAWSTNAQLRHLPFWLAVASTWSHSGNYYYLNTNLEHTWVGMQLAQVTATKYNLNKSLLFCVMKTFIKEVRNHLFIVQQWIKSN